MPKPRQPRLVAPAPGRRCGQLPRSSPPSSRALLAGPRVVHVVPVDDLPVWWSGPQFPWQFSCGSIVKWAPRSHAASRAQWGPDFLDSPGQGRHPLPQLSGELSWTSWEEVRGAVFDPPGSPRVTFSSDSRWWGEPLTGCVLCRALRLPVCFGAHLPFFKVFGRKLLPLHLSLFVAAA